MLKDTIGFIILIIVLFALGAFFLLAPKTPQVAYVPIDVEYGTIHVEDQDDIDVVTLDVELSEAGWITIHESMSNAPAAIVGTSNYLEAGVHEDLQISIADQMKPGFLYITLMHVDNGDKVYVTNDDLPARVDGEVVRPSFTAVPDAVTIPEPGSIPLEEN